jgi:hypothetical protein
MRIRVLGKSWDFSFKTLPFMGKDWGLCSPPHIKRKWIHVLDTLRGRDALDTVAHELLHAAAWDVLKEEFVDTLARDISKVIFTEEVLVKVLDDPLVRKVFDEHFREGSGVDIQVDTATRPAIQEEFDQPGAARGDGSSQDSVGEG